jgi:hypothetical protein
MSDIL